MGVAEPEGDGACEGLRRTLYSHFLSHSDIDGVGGTDDFNDLVYAAT